MKKRIAALLLALALVASLTACGSSNSKGENGASGTSNSADPCTINITIPNGTGLTLSDEEEIEAALSALLAEDNITVDLHMVSFGQYNDQITLGLSTQSEELDIFFALPGSNTSYMQASGQIIALDDYIDQYGQGIKDALGEYYNAGMSADGHIYSIPQVRDMAYSEGLVIRKDVLDAAGIDINDIHSMDDIGAMCAKIQESGAWDGAILDHVENEYFYDYLGDYLGVIMDYEDSLTVENLYESEEYIEWAKTIREWYLAGYMYPEAATSEDNSQTKAANGLVCGFIGSAKPGKAEEESQNTGYEMVATTWGDTMTTTSQVASVTWQVSSQCKNYEAAVKVLNMMYSSEEFANILCYGIEGKHYVFNDDGTVTYPEGVDSKTTGWTFAMNWMTGNEFLTYLWEGNDPNLWEQTKEFNASAKLPLAFGFSPNLEEVSTQLAACQAVREQYKMSLYTGELDVDTALAEMNAKLYASGLQDIIDLKQQQLDEWAAANKVSVD